MSKRVVLQALLATAVAAVALSAQQRPDPKANDQTGNGPPAVVLGGSQGDKGGSAADKKKAASERPVSGFVTDADGKPVTGAIVQLKNTRTLQVRSFITREKGDYYFAGLSKDVDYELKAQLEGHTSAAKTLSSFDPKEQPVINLQIK